MPLPDIVQRLMSGVYNFVRTGAHPADGAGGALYCYGDNAAGRPLMFAALTNSEHHAFPLGGANYTEVSSATYDVVESDQILLIDTTAAAVQINLPATASMKKARVLWLCDAAGTWNVNNVTVAAGSGTTIQGGASITLSTANKLAILMSPSASRWGTNL